EHTPYFYTMHALASRGIDTLNLQFRILAKPKFSAYIVAYALNLGRTMRSFIFFWCRTKANMYPVLRNEPESRKIQPRPRHSSRRSFMQPRPRRSRRSNRLLAVPRTPLLLEIVRRRWSSRRHSFDHWSLAILT